jgi:hypothetical protein
MYNRKGKGRQSNWLILLLAIKIKYIVMKEGGGEDFESAIYITNDPRI